MRKDIKFTSLMLSLFFCLSAVAFGQETTGNIEGIVRDPAGAVVPNVTVTVASFSGATDASGTTTPSGVSTGFRRTVTTGSDGFFRVVQVPPGVYVVTTEATSGFGAARYENVQVVLGKTSQLEIAVAAGQATATVDVGISDQPVDTTSTEISTSVTTQKIELLPKGVDFTSVLKTVPGVRPEPLAGGFSIDGASGAENSFIIDGQEVTNYRNAGLNGNNAIPFSIVQEVQVKSSGFNAEYGGATGGVINVVTKGGNNEFHGDFGMEFATPKLNGNPRPTQLRFTSGTVGSTTNPFTQSVEYFSAPKGKGASFFPNATFSGPIVKDRLWFFGNYSPQIYEDNIETVFLTNVPAATRTETNREQYRRTRKFEYAFARLDAQPISRLRLTGTYLWNPIVDQGNIPFGTVSFGGTPATVNYGGTIGTLRGGELAARQGGRQSSNNVTGQAVYTATNNLIFSFRYSRGFLNEKLGNYFIPTGTRYICQNGNVGSTTFANACTQGQNDPANDATVKDVSVRTNYEGDATALFNAGGRHELKGGYQHQSIFNDLQKADTTRIYLQYGVPITENFNWSTAAEATPGAIGHGVLYRYAERGQGSNLNQAVFVQDQWQPFRRLTLNLGVRIEKEDLPSFNEFPAPFGFSWNDKIAPRLGAAFDLFGNGKSKIFASYGKFYDRLKFKMAQGSFGGNFYRVDFFEIFANSGPFRTAFTPQTILGNFNDRNGGLCPATGFIGSGLSRCQNDYRVASNNPEANIEESGAIDVDLKPYSQREFTVGMEHQLTNDFVVRGRFTNKKLLNAVEDAGVISAQGSEIYVTGNPGQGLHADFLESFGYNGPYAKPERDYRALELTLEKRLSNNYYFNLNYTLSRLYGNYSGLANSDEAGRSDPGVNRSFDLPFIGYNARGELDNGRLATDRPHVFNAYGAYIFDWFGSKSNSTEIGAFQTFQSGTPVTSTVAFVTTTLFDRRGDLGRTPMLSQTDLTVNHKYRFGRDDRYTMAFNVNVINLLDQDTVTGIFANRSAVTIGLTSLRNSAGGALFSNYRDLINAYNAGQLYDPINAYLNAAPNRTDSRYGQPSAFQGARSVRFGFRFLF